MRVNDQMIGDLTVSESNSEHVEGLGAQKTQMIWRAEAQVLALKS